MSNLDLDNAFWRFSLKVYAAPGVEAECMALQAAHDIDVNVLLFGAWLGVERGVRLDPTGLADVQDVVCPWREAVIKPLRLARKAIKAMTVSADPAVGALRASIAREEIDAERIEQALLYTRAPVAATVAGGAGPLPQIVRENLTLVIGSYAGGNTERRLFPEALIAESLDVAAGR